MFRRVAKWGLAGGAVVLTLSSLHQNHWEASTIGLLRFGRAAVTVGRIAVDYKLSLRGLDPSSEEYDNLRSEVHLRSAGRLLDLCCLNGGCFVKVGQHIGALNYLLPPEYTRTLSVLHNRAPRAPLADVLQVIREDLGHEASEVFASFDPEPIGAASLAQVHRATLRSTGEAVAVKVQHRRVAAHSRVDMATMEVLVRAVDRLFPEFTFAWLAEETKRNLPLELDFEHEGRNAQRIATTFAHLPWLKVPRIHFDLTTPRVLTMELCEGGQVDDAEWLSRHRVSPALVSRRLGELYSAMIFESGCVHCDPHPGNILVQSDGGIVLLDHGLYVDLSAEFRTNYCQMWLCLLRADVAGVEAWGRRLGAGELFGLLACMLTARSWTAVTTGIQATKTTLKEKAEIRSNAATYFPEITRVLSRVPREMLLILKTNDLLRGIEGALGVRGAASSFVTMSRCCIRSVYAEELRRSASLLRTAQILFSRTLAHARLFLHQTILWLFSLQLH